MYAVIEKSDKKCYICIDNQKTNTFKTKLFSVYKMQVIFADSKALQVRFLSWKFQENPIEFQKHFKPLMHSLLLRTWTDFEDKVNPCLCSDVITFISFENAVRSNVLKYCRWLKQRSLQKLSCLFFYPADILRLRVKLWWHGLNSTWKQHLFTFYQKYDSLFLLKKTPTARSKS